MRTRCGNIEPDRAAIGCQAAVAGGVSDRCALSTPACARRSRGPEQARLASRYARSWLGRRDDRGHILRLLLAAGLPWPRHPAGLDYFQMTLVRWCWDAVLDRYEVNVASI